MEIYLDFAKGLAKEAEEIALKYFSFSVESTRKDDGTPLTKADIEINDLVIKRINETFPEHSIYGEEKSEIKYGSKYIWVCDPLDGTVAFSSGLPMFTFSIALVDQSDGQPIFGLVNDPFMKTMYWAYKGGGAYRNGTKISVSGSASLKNTYAITGASGSGLGISPITLIENSYKNKCTVMRFGSFIYGAIQVANGKFAAGIFYAKEGHDVAALKIITEEAGGKVTDLRGEERRYDQDGFGCLISNGILHDELLKSISMIII